MQDVIQAQAQPFVKLAQANMDLFTRFSTSPEVMGQATTSATNLFQQATESAMKLMQSGAYAQVMQGLLKNYTEFLTEISHSAMAMMSQGQAALLRQTEQVTESVVDASDVRARRSRNSA